jgi:hypothetical protein
VVEVDLVAVGGRERLAAVADALPRPEERASGELQVRVAEPEGRPEGGRHRRILSVAGPRRRRD